jgi:adenine-specific DNA-methyltransferase
VSLISLQKTGGQEATFIPNVADYIVWYSKNAEVAKYRQLYFKKELGVGEGSGQRYDRVQTEVGARRSLNTEEKTGSRKLPEDVRPYQLTSLISSGIRTHTTAEWIFRNESFHSGATSNWKTSLKGLDTLAKADRVEPRATTVAYVRFIDDFPAYPMSNIWTDVAGAVGKIYVVQTSTTIVQRCILMATDPGDLVLDPTCGSGTTAYVAEQWGRRWITVDTSRVALALARSRLMGARYDYYLLKDSKGGAEKESEITAKPTGDGPFANNLRHNFVYDRASHVTLKSIANNAEIDVIWERWQKTLEPLREALNKALKKKWEEWQIPREAGDPWAADAARTFYDIRTAQREKLDVTKLLEQLNKQLGRGLELNTLPDKPIDPWPEATTKLHAQWWEARCARQKEIDDSIARNAEVEYLYDRPYKARGVVRVAGPFTVESLSPHRVLPMGEDPYLEELLAAGEDASAIVPDEAKKDVDGRDKPGHDDKGGTVITDFAQVVYENMKTSGVQNTKKGERLMLENLRPFASKSGLIAFQGEYKEKGQAKRAAVSIGPEYDTVGYELVRRAAREALDAFDMLVVCGFAFAPEVDDTRLNFGELVILKARMNQDLRMADKLKATGAGNLFVVFGEPDIAIHKLKDDMLKVEIKGMDIFDPTTAEVRSSTGKDLMNDVAAWFIDSDYDEESFFVRQAYFVGNDPYEGLKRALKAEIDETAWAELNSTVSRPFPRPSHGRICVKVINHFGDEVQKVFQV